MLCDANKTNYRTKIGSASSLFVKYDILDDSFSRSVTFASTRSWYKYVKWYIEYFHVWNNNINRTIISLTLNLVASSDMVKSCRCTSSVLVTRGRCSSFILSDWCRSSMNCFVYNPISASISCMCQVNVEYVPHWY